MSVSERDVKKLKDFTEEVKSSLPELTALATHQFDEAMNQMLALEKKTRLAADSLNSVKVATTILETCVQHQRWQALNDHISILCKRRAQLQRVYESVVQTAYTFVAKTPDDATKRALIDCLRMVSAGKIFVELERARLTKQLAEMEESEDRTAAAADILLEVQVETIGTMEAREKLEFLLEQVRLCLAKRDYVRTDIIAKKVDTKVLKKDDMSDLRIRFYKLIIQYHNHFGNYLAIANAYREIFYTPSILVDPALWKDALIGVVVYAILSPFDSETSDLLHRIQQEKKLSALPAFANMLNEFLGDELMQWPLMDEKVWRDHSIFSADLAADGTLLVTVSSSSSSSSSSPSSSTSSSSTAMVIDSSSLSSSSSSALDAEKIIVHDRVQRWKDLHKRVVQHNIRVIANYYSRITLKRLSSLLCVSDGDDAELFLSEMVTSKQLYAKIDRHVGIIQFAPPQQSELVLLEFTNDVERLLALVDQTTHLISKENMVHKIRA